MQKRKIQKPDIGLGIFLGNMKKSMERKIKKKEILELGDKLLLVNKCNLNKSNNEFKKKKIKPKNL